MKEIQTNDVQTKLMHCIGVHGPRAHSQEMEGMGGIAEVKRLVIEGDRVKQRTELAQEQAEQEYSLGPKPNHFPRNS